MNLKKSKVQVKSEVEQICYSIKFNRTFRKLISALPEREKKIVVNIVENLKTNPRPNNCEKIKSYTNTYRIRFGNYRLIYQIKKKELNILLLLVGHRKDIYEKLKSLK